MIPSFLSMMMLGLYCDFALSSCKSYERWKADCRLILIQCLKQALHFCCKSHVTLSGAFLTQVWNWWQQTPDLGQCHYTFRYAVKRLSTIYIMDTKSTRLALPENGQAGAVDRVHRLKPLARLRESDSPTVEWTKLQNFHEKHLQEQWIAPFVKRDHNGLPTGKYTLCTSPSHPRLHQSSSVHAELPQNNRAGLQRNISLSSMEGLNK